MHLVSKLRKGEFDAFTLHDVHVIQKSHFKLKDCVCLFVWVYVCVYVLVISITPRRKNGENSNFGTLHLYFIQIIHENFYEDWTNSLYIEANKTI